LGKKFCKLDINMIVNGQLVDLEVQVDDEKFYEERAIYYWTKEFINALNERESYAKLPRTIIINIISFNIFDCVEFYSEFRPMEVTRHTLLSDKMVIIFYELLKLPAVNNADDKLKLWLALFKAETEEDLAKIYALEVPEMNQAIDEYNAIVVSPEFRELERMRDRAKHAEAQALWNARFESEQRADKKWESIVAVKDAALADKDAEIARLRALLGE